METAGPGVSLEEQIDQWRNYLRRRQAIHSVDVAELEDHLREQVAVLIDAGLATDEAFLIAVKRMGDLDALSREFAREHSDRLWKQLVVSPSDRGEPQTASRTDAVVAFGLAAAAAVAVKVPALFGMQLDEDDGFYARNVGLFVLPFLTGYFAWKRALDRAMLGWLALAFVAAAVFANVYPFDPDGSTEALTALARADRALARRGRCVRRQPVDPGRGPHGLHPVLGRALHLLRADRARRRRPHGVHGGAVQRHRDRPRAVHRVVAASLRGGRGGRRRLVAGGGEAERDREHGARADAPLHAPLRGRAGHVPGALCCGPEGGVDIERDTLIQFNLILVVVLGLLLYSISARDPRSSPGAFDALQVVLVVGALLADAVALWAIAARISEFGFSANRVAALGVNVILLVNLAWSAVLYVRFLRGRGSFAGLEKWQTDYLPVYAVWAAVVVIVFPPAFGYA